MDTMTAATASQDHIDEDHDGSSLSDFHAMGDGMRETAGLASLC